jgi:uncharacterized membrane protein YozB (DUF420 family)
MVLNVSQANIVLQIVIFAVVLAGFALAKRGRFLVHGVMMLFAVLLSIFSFLWVMEPSLLNLEQFISNHALDRISLVTIAHGFLGAAVMILGVWFVASWGLRKSASRCVGKRRIMLLTLILWAITFFLGLLLYVLLYTTLI